MQFNYRREFNIRRKVLIVDDEIMNRNFLGDLIGKDFDVLYAENGVQALEVINAKASTLSLVLLDLEMPVMSGFDLLLMLFRSLMTCLNLLLHVFTGPLSLPKIPCFSATMKETV